MLAVLSEISGASKSIIKIQSPPPLVEGTYFRPLGLHKPCFALAKLELSYTY